MLDVVLLWFKNLFTSTEDIISDHFIYDKKNPIKVKNDLENVVPVLLHGGIKIKINLHSIARRHNIYIYKI